MKKFSVIIVTYNSEKHIYDCLESIATNNDIGDDLEIIVVDNCSKDFDVMKTEIHEKFPDVLIISNTQNGGYGQGNNIGASNSCAPYVMIMNPDVRLTNPVFKRFIQEFENDSNVVMCGMKQYIPGFHQGIAYDFSFRFPTYLSAVLSYFTRRLDMYIPRYMYFTGSCFCVRKSSFVNAGMFDENIFMYGEEDDLHSRMKLIKNAKFKYIKDLSYNHLHDPTPISFDYSFRVNDSTLKSRLYWNKRDGYNELYTIKKSIQDVNVYIFREYIRSIFGNINKEYIQYLKKWKACLQNKLKEK